MNISNSPGPAPDAIRTGGRHSAEMREAANARDGERPVQLFSGLLEKENAKQARTDDTTLEQDAPGDFEARRHEQDTGQVEGKAAEGADQQQQDIRGDDKETAAATIAHGTWQGVLTGEWSVKGETSAGTAAGRAREISGPEPGGASAVRLAAQHLASLRAQQPGAGETPTVAPDTNAVSRPGPSPDVEKPVQALLKGDLPGTGSAALHGRSTEPVPGSTDTSGTRNAVNSAPQDLSLNSAGLRASEGKDLRAAENGLPVRLVSMEKHLPPPRTESAQLQAVNGLVVDSVREVARQAAPPQPTHAASLSGSPAADIQKPAMAQARSIEIELHPRELGNVRVRLTMIDNRVSVEITTTTLKGHSLLSSNHDTMVRSISEAGTSLSDLSLRLSTDGQTDRSLQSPGGSGPQGSNADARNHAGEQRGRPQFDASGDGDPRMNSRSESGDESSVRQFDGWYF